MKKFVCSVCGYVHTAEELAADFRCPVCRVPASKFVEQKGELKLAAEHEYGVYGKTVNQSIQYRASNLDWQLVSYMIFYMFQCHSPKSSHPLPLPQSP